MRRFLTTIFLVLFVMPIMAQSEEGEAATFSFESHSLLYLYYNSGAVMLLIDPITGQIVRANDAAADYYGWSREELESKTILQINTFLPDQVAAEMELARDEGRNYFIFRHRLSSGELRTVQVFSMPVLIDNRKLLYSVIQDVTTLRDIENDLWHYQNRLEEMVELRSQELLSTTRIYNIILIFVLFFQASVIIILIFNIAARRRIQRELHQALEHQEQQIVAAVQTSRIQDQIIYSQQRQQALSNLLVSLAHQWRQPLNGVGLIIQRMQDELEEGTLTTVLGGRLMNQALFELTRLSSTITRFTQLYETRDNYEKVNLSESLQISVEYLQPQLKTPPIIVQNQIGPAADIFASRADLVEIFVKLLENVQQVTVNRKLTAVEVVVRADERPEGVLITVDDNAGGIDAEILPVLFDPYSTSHFPSPDKGLGLFMLRRLIIEKYSGSIDGFNYGPGARFEILLRKVKSHGDRTLSSRDSA